MADSATTLNAEQREQLKQVFDLFTPYAASKAQNLYPTKDSRAKFVHYTSAEAALGIITTKRLWMRNTTCMADFREVNHGFDILQRLYDSKLKGLFAELDLARILDRVIIGPTQYPLAVLSALIAALTAAGVADANSKIVVSDIPIRT